MGEWTRDKHERVNRVLGKLGYMRDNSIVLVASEDCDAISMGDVRDATKEIERLRSALDWGERLDRVVIDSLIEEVRDEMLHEIKKQHSNIVDACGRIERIEDALGGRKTSLLDGTSWGEQSEYTTGECRTWHIERGPNGEIRRHSKAECLPACPLHLGIPHGQG